MVKDAILSWFMVIQEKINEQNSTPVILSNEKTDLKRANIYLYIKQNTFSKQFKIGQRAVAWLESDIDIALLRVWLKWKRKVNSYLWL